MRTLVYFCYVFLLLVFLISKVNCSPVSLFGIVEPFPQNIYPIEFTSAQVTCVAFDQTGIKVPEKIVFTRRDEFHIYRDLVPTDNLYFTKETEDVGNKTKIYVTMYIRNVTLDDDSLYGPLGSYECHAYAVGYVNPKIHGFAVSVITRRERPRVAVSKFGDLQHGGITLICNVTERGNSASTPLKRMSWIKDGKLLESVRYPDEQNTLGPLIIIGGSVKDGGRYTCLLEVLLRNVKEYNVTDSTFIHITPWFEQKREQKYTTKTGESVTLECSAKGFPLNVEWKFKKNGIVKSCIDSSTNKRYNITRKGIYEPYYLTVSDLATTDTGSYYCCLPSNCSVNIDEDRCQRFSLTVEDTENPTDLLTDGTMALASQGVLVTMAFFMVSFLILY